MIIFLLGFSINFFGTNYDAFKKTNKNVMTIIYNFVNIKWVKQNFNSNKGTLKYDYKSIIRSIISKAKFIEILSCFANTIEATKIVKICNISRSATNKIIKQIRNLMTNTCEKISEISAR